jgi:hypothetical protein
VKNKIVLGFYLLVFPWFCLGIQALSLEDLVGREQAGVLLSGEKPVLAQFDKQALPKLIPKNAFLSGFVDKARRDLDPGVMVESLYIYEKPASAKKDAWSPEEEAKLYNATLALSTLAGLEYYSASRGAMRTFYETSSVIDNPTAKKPLPDPSYPRPPAQLILYARQKDSTFGDNIYQYDYYSGPGAMIFIQQNLTSLNYGIIPAVGKNKLHSVVAVLDAGDHLLVYMSSMSKSVSLPGIKERLGNSFANRAEAIFNWFSGQADKAF